MEEDAFTLLHNWFREVLISPQPADVIIAFGGTNREIPQKAAWLLTHNYADVVVCTGAKTPLSAHLEQASEAEFYASILRETGIDSSQIIIEPHATHTGENVANSLALLHERGMLVHRIITCANPFHQRRVVATVRKHLPRAFVVPVEVAFDMNTFKTKRGIPFSLRLAEELERLIVYAERGFIAPTDIPQDVLDAAKCIITEYSHLHREP